MSIIINSTVPLDVASIKAEAGFGPGETLRFMDGLERLTAALDSEAGLTHTGRQAARSSLVKALAIQRDVSLMRQGKPDVAIQPIVITGLLRSGTTFLQELLSHHPAVRSPQLWELMAPASTESPERLIRSCESYVDDYYRAAPVFRSIHPLEARKPEECHRLTANSFRHFIFALRYRVPSYVTWLRQQPMTEAYAFHREQLSCLLERQPGKIVLLKCPSHLWYQEDLAAVYPDAKVIRLHRRPSVSIPSVASLTAVVRAARSTSIDPDEIGSYWLREATTALRDLRRGEGPMRTPPLDIRFSDLIADPARVAAQVCDYTGLPMSPRMTAFLASQRKTVGTHRYRAEDFGLSTELLDEHFADYNAEFGL